MTRCAPGTPRRTLTSRRTRAILRCAVGAGLLGLLAARTDLSGAALKSPVNAGAAVAAAVLLLTLAQAFSALRWRLVLGPHAPPWSYLFRVYLIGQFFSLFLPTSVGGDAFRAIVVSQAAAHVSEGVSSVLLDRLLGVMALAIYLTAGLVLTPLAWEAIGPLQWPRLPDPLLGAAVVAALIAVLLLARSSHGGRLADAVVRGIMLWRRLVHAPRLLLSALSVSLLVQAAYIAAWAVLTRSVGLSIPLGFLFVSVPLVSLAAMLPVTISGLGVREGAWALLLALVGVPASAAVTSSLLYFAAFILVGALGGLWFMLQGTRPRSGVAD